MGDFFWRGIEDVKKFWKMGGNFMYLGFGEYCVYERQRLMMMFKASPDICGADGISERASASVCGAVMIKMNDGARR